MTSCKLICDMRYRRLYGIYGAMHDAIRDAMSQVSGSQRVYKQERCAYMALVLSWVGSSLVPRLSVGGERESLVHTVCACV